MSSSKDNNRSVNSFILLSLAVVVGIFAGIGAVIFRGLIALFHNILFLGQFSFSYNANIHTPESLWGWGVIFVPVLGALGVAFLVKNFAPEAKGHGVPEVIDAIYYNHGKIRPIVAVIKSLASALSIGSGGAIGREGPIIQIGASFASTLGQLFPLSNWQKFMLIAAGAAGGIAATFNTPVGGILFAIEIIMVEISVRTLVPVAISTVIATYIGRVFFGEHPSFIIPSLESHYFHLQNPFAIITYAGLGIILGVISAVYIKSIYSFEDFFDNHIPGNYYVKHMLGMLMVGIMIYILMINFGHYYVEGVGYSTVQDILSGVLTSLPVLLLLFLLKLLATSLTLGSGASGGIFSPSLFMGATLGGAYGIIINAIFPEINVHPAAFAVAGMAGMVASATGAVMTGIVMIFEMTLDYTVIIPLVITVAIAYQVRYSLLKPSIYTLKLIRRGHDLPESLEANFPLLKRANKLMDKHFIKISPDLTTEKLFDLVKENSNYKNFIVTENDDIYGIITKEMILSSKLVSENNQLTAKQLADVRFLKVFENEPLTIILPKLQKQKRYFVLVLSKNKTNNSNKILGVITKEKLGESYIQSMELVE